MYCYKMIQRMEKRSANPKNDNIRDDDDDIDCGSYDLRGLCAMPKLLSFIQLNILRAIYHLA